MVAEPRRTLLGTPLLRFHFHCYQLAGLLLVALLFIGCGGSSQSVSRVGSLTLKVKWPTEGRLIPYDSASIVAVVTDAHNNVLGTQTLARPAEGVLTTSVTFSNLNPGADTLTATAYPTGAGTGVAQATGASPVTVVANENAPVTVTMADTIVSIQISANGTIYSGSAQSIPVTVGATVPLAETAYDAKSEVVLTSPTTIQWSISNANASISSSGVLTGLVPGPDTVTVKETESGVSASAKVSVSTTVLDKSPGFVTVDAAGAHAYIVLKGGIHVFDIESNGQLSFVQEIAAPNVNPAQTPYEYFPAILTPDGKHFYAYAGPTSAVIYQFNVQSDGTLVSLGSISAPIYGTSFACDPSNQFLYLAGIGTSSGQVTIYPIPASGVLGTPTDLDNLSPTTPYGIDRIPGTPYMFGDSVNTSVGFYALTMTVNADGSLNLVSNLNYPESDSAVYRAQPPHVFTPSGNEVFTFDGNQIGPFTIDPSGVPALATSYAMPSGDGSLQGVVSPSGTYLWVRGYGGDAEIYPFNIGGGTLNPLTVTGTSLPVERSGSIAITPNGQYIYTTNLNDNSISEFSTNADGSLTPLSPAKVTG
jgi:6-phosphogluconolactonase (cycloisomerase 2 family)